MSYDDDDPLMYRDKPLPKLPPRPKPRSLPFTNSPSYIQPIEYQYQKIQDPKSPNYGFYQMVPIRSATQAQQVYTRVKFEDPMPAHSGYSQKGDYYYIPRNDQLPIRNLVYAVQNDKLPTTGDLETYHSDFSNIGVPQDYCPNIDPCKYDWCKKCQQPVRLKPMPIIHGPTLSGILITCLFILFFCYVSGYTLLYY